MNNNQPWHNYPLIKNELNAVNNYIEKEINLPYPQLETALKAMAQNGGKYLRPALLILSAKASGQNYNSDRIIKAASSIEILHMASLIHDDIVDDSDKRRGAISIQAKFGKDIAVYAGDFLFTKFFDLILDLDLNHQYLVTNAQTMRHILNGELGQARERFNINQNFNQYLDHISGKTTALFSLAAQEGAYLAHSNLQAIDHLTNYGKNLGIAFQIIDDILDYTGSSKLNKPTLEDISTGVYSLPLLLALNSEVRNDILPLLSKKQEITIQDIDHLQDVILNSSVIEKSHQIAKQYTLQALDSLDSLPNTQAKKLLTHLTKKLLDRTI